MKNHNNSGMAVWNLENLYVVQKRQKQKIDTFGMLMLTNSTQKSKLKRRE